MDILKIKKEINQHTTIKYTPRIRKKIINITSPRTECMYTIDFGMAFVSKDYKQVTSFVSCRDYLHDQIRTALNDKRCIGDGHPYHPELGDPKPYMNKLQLLIQIKEELLDRFLTGLTALNNIEVFSGVRKTKVFKAIYSNINSNKKLITLFVDGSSLYMHNPHLLSILTLVLRFFTLNDTIKYTFTNDLKLQYGDILTSHGKDTHLIKNCYKYMHIILKEHKNIFKDITLHKLFPVKSGTLFHARGGIEKLCLADTLNSTVNEKIKQLYAIYAE